ncbi:MAG: SHOCT domain-containing protein, partial [Gaiellaceae bacterium]
PIFGNRAWAFGTAAVLFLLLLWWHPTAQTGRPLQMLVLALFIAVGIEALYRLTVRDFPAEAAMAPGESIRARWAARHDEGRADAAPSASAELERLARLHDTGALTDEEFAGEKARVLART